MNGFRLGFWLITALAKLAALIVLVRLRRTAAASVHRPAAVPPETSLGMVT